MARPTKIDATHFHATGPHAASKSAARTAAPPNAPIASVRKSTGPPGETPQEKVRRLREAAQRAKSAQVSTFDKAIVRGRVWADRAHRFTALSLIGITGIAGVVTAYALGDMMIHNRRKRAEYFAEQKALHASKLWDAQKALKAGTASEEQVMLIQMERQLDAEQEAKKARPGVFARSKEWLFSGMKKDESEESVQGATLEKVEDVGQAMSQQAQQAKSGILSAVAEKKEATEKKVSSALEAERERQRNGGMLDRLGTSAETEESPKAGGWTSFMTRR